MAKSTIALIVGLVVGGGMFAFGLNRYEHHNAVYQAASNECHALQAQTPSHVCGPYELRVWGDKVVGNQKILVDSFAALEQWSDTYAAGLAIAFLLAVPWFWYFLLRRIGELRNAILGKSN